MVDFVDIEGNKEGQRECTEDHCLSVASADMKMDEQVELWN